MPQLRVLFNTLEALNMDEICPKVKSLGIEAVTVFGNLGWRELPEYLRKIAKEFKDIRVNLIHDPTYRNQDNWKQKLREDGKRIISVLAESGINEYQWMIECNSGYGHRWHPIWGKYIHHDKLADNFNYFYDIAHSANPKANVIVVPYPHSLLNLNSGISGWKDWWIKTGEKLKFDSVALDAHVGIWIFAWSDKLVYASLIDAIGFLKARGYPVSSVEVGYPTCGFKPLLGLYGWGREIDQVRMLKTCYRALSDCNIPFMQICEFIDPDPRGQVYEKFFVEEGKLIKLLGVPIAEEANWGLLRRDGREKMACAWVKQVMHPLDP